MRFKQMIILTILLGSFSINAQDKKTSTTEIKELIKDLTLAQGKDLAAKQIRFDGESFPIYDLKGKRIRGEKMMEFLNSGDYIPDFYWDKDQEVKVAVLRLTTGEEKERMKKMRAQSNGQSELIGKDAFTFTATDINGHEYSLNSLKGKTIVMNFWFVECKPCVEEMPELNKLVENYKNKEVVFLGFALNDKSNIATFLKENDFSYNIIPDSRKIATEYEVLGFPTHIIIDENSKIAYATSGLGPTTISDIEKTIENLMKK